MKKLVSLIFLLTVALGFSQPTFMPTTPPVRTGSNVLSIFSGAYTNQTGVAFLNFGASTINADLSLTGSPAGISKSYSGHSYSGMQVNTGGVLNVSGMTHLHLDVYSTNYNSLAVKLESSTGAAIELPVTGSIVPSSSTRNQWISLDLALNTYNTGNILTSLKYILPVTYAQNATLYITNVYFYKPEATLSAPALTTTLATAIASTTATINGNISSNGGANITSYGFYWSTTNGFANGEGTQVVKGINNFTGAISHNLTGLTTSTIYYYKAYATNSIGTTYGTQQSFTAITAPTLGAFSVPAKSTSDVPFPLTAPTSNSGGAFTYTSSNTAVATISGTTITIVGVGTSIITATQAANGAYSSGSTTASFVVSAPSIPAAPVPIRLAANVLSVYSGTYTPAFGIVTWAQTSDETLAGNATKLVTNLGYGQGAYASTSISGMTFIHVDIYSTTANTSQIKVQVNTIVQGNYATPNGAWTSLDLPLSNFLSPATSNLVNLKAYTGVGTFYFDNIYFYKRIQPTFTQVAAICSGATLAALPTTSNNGINGTWSPAINNTATTTYTFTPTSDPDAYTATMTITVNPVINPSVSIAVSPSTTVCAGTSVAFTATPTNGGASPSYQWQVNESNDGTNSATYTSTTLANNAAVRVVMTSNATCATGIPATSTPITMTVNATPAITITTAQPNCSSSTGTITVTPPSNELGITYTVTRTSPVVGVVTNEEGVFNGLSVGNYTVTTTNASGCISAPASSTINTFTPVINTWTAAGWSNGTPTSDQKIVFSENYNTNVASISANIIACSCQVNSGTVTIGSGNTMTLTNSLTVSGGSLTFEDTASLVQTNDAAINSGSILYKRTTSTLSNNYDFVFWGSPLAAQEIRKIWMASNWADTFYNYNPGTPGWARTYAANTMTPGKGYIARARNGQQGWDYNNTVSTFTVGGTWNAKFFGVPNNGTISVTDCEAGKYCLLGNPYPSAIDADKFLSANSSVLDGTLYFWTHNTPLANNAYNSNDYASYNGVGGTKTTRAISSGLNTSVPTGKIAAGQGFFAKATATATATVTFNNTMRVGTEGAPLVNTQFFRTSNTKAKTTNSIEKHRVWLNVSNTQGFFKQTLVGYVTDATNAYDSRFDGESMNGNTYTDFYSINENKNLTIQGRAVPFDENDTVPLGFKTTIAGSFTIDIDEVDGLLTNQAVYLEDKGTNTIFNLKNGNYTFTTDKGTFNDRFVLRYTDKTLGTAAVEKPANQILVTIQNKQIKITSFAETIEKVFVYDVSGKQCYQKRNVNNTELLITTLAPSHQILLVKTVLQNGKSSTKKVLF